MPIPRFRAAHCAAAIALSCPALVAAQTPPPTLADPQHHEGTIVRIDQQDLVLDVGALSGASDGDRYDLYRPVTVRHPVTGRALRDRFRIGTVHIASASQVLSIAQADGALTRPPEVGDILVPTAAASAPRPAEVASGAPSDATVQAPGATPEERAAIGAWLATLGRAPSDRIALYHGYLREHPDSPFGPRVRDEITALRRLERSPLPNAPAPAAPPAPPRPTAQSTDEGTRHLRVADPAIIALQYGIASPEQAAIVQYRAHGEALYQHIVLRPEGDGFVRGEVPASVVQPPGFEYFVEAVDTHGAVIPLLGASDAPIRVQVDPPLAVPRTEPGRSRIDVHAEYADIGSTAARTESFTLVEMDFLQRVQWGPLYGYRVGFGGYHGEGQPLCAYDNTCRPSVSTTSTAATAVYGYHEFEFALSSFVHLMLRLETGLNQGGVAFGAGARMRVGRERGTHIVFGGDAFDGVGQKGFFAFNFFPLAALSMMAQGEVFNQQVDGGDPMFRFVGQAGYRVASNITLSLRGSYQLRNIAHGGFGGGAAVTFDW